MAPCAYFTWSAHAQIWLVKMWIFIDRCGNADWLAPLFSLNIYICILTSNLITLFQIPNPFWSPTKLEITTRTVVDEKELFNTREKTEILEFPLIESNHPQNFPNAVGMRYEAEAVRECIVKGRQKNCLWSDVDTEGMTGGGGGINWLKIPYIINLLEGVKRAPCPNGSLKFI